MSVAEESTWAIWDGLDGFVSRPPNQILTVGEVRAGPEVVPTLASFLAATTGLQGTFMPF